MKNHFDQHAKEWDKETLRTDNAKKIAESIKKQIPICSHFKILDFGVGTGLLSWEFGTLVDSILGVDTSEEMLKSFLSKNWPCKVETHSIEINNDIPHNNFHGIMTSMTMHHVENVERYFLDFNSLLKKDGFLAIADLVTEDGDFHTSGNEGTYHFGFDPIVIESMLEKNGFYDISHTIVNSIEKEIATGETKRFPIFLVLAKKI